MEGVLLNEVGGYPSKKESGGGGVSWLTGGMWNCNGESGGFENHVFCAVEKPGDQLLSVP